MLPFLRRATDSLGVPNGFVTSVKFSVDIVFVVRSVGGTVGVEEGTIKKHDETMHYPRLSKTLKGPVSRPSSSFCSTWSLL